MDSQISVYKDYILSKTTTFNNKDIYYSNSKTHDEKEKKNDNFVNITKEKYLQLYNDCDLNLYFKSTFALFKIKNENENESDNSELPRGMINIFRNDRNYGSISYKNHRNNGSQNYTVHYLDYKSKKINRLIGMNYNKGINQNINSQLTIFLQEIQTYHEKFYTSDKSHKKKYNNLINIAKKHNIKIDEYLDPEPEPSPVPTPSPFPPEPEPSPVPTPSPVPPDPEPSPVPTPSPVPPDPEPSPVPTPSPVPPDPEPEPTSILQGTSIYLALKKKNKTGKYIELFEDKIMSKIGYTNSSPTKRFQGSVLNDGFEPIMIFELIGDESEAKILEQNLYQTLNRNDNIEFENNSNEIFTYRPEMKPKIIEIFYNRCKLLIK